MGRARFITFEGGEGAGKSTQVRLLAERLGAAGHEVVVTREPGGTPFAEQVRALILDPRVADHEPLSEALLFYAARADHIAKVIRPAIARGAFVLCDRFSDSTRVYQSLAGGLPREVFTSLEGIVVGDARPALTLILDIDPAQGLARARARRDGAGARASAAGEDRYEAKALGFHRRLRDGFLAIAAEEPQRCVVIDAARAADAIAADVWAAAQSRLLHEAR